MKILVFQANEKELDAVQQYVLEKAVVEVFDNSEELIGVINLSDENKLALIIPDAEEELIEEWTGRIKTEYPHVHLIPLDTGIGWQGSLKEFLEAPEPEVTLTSTEINLDETANTANVELLSITNTEPEIDASDLEFEASSNLDLSETSPTVAVSELQLSEENDFQEETEEVAPSDNGLEFDDVDDDKTQVISLDELGETIDTEAEPEVADSGMDLGIEEEADLGLSLLSDEELEADLGEEEEEVLVCDNGLSFDESDDLEISIGSLDDDHTEDGHEDTNLDQGLDFDETEKFDDGLSIGLDDDPDDSSEELSLEDEPVDEDDDLGLSLEEENEELSASQELSLDESDDEEMDDSEVDISADDLGINDEDLLSFDGEDDTDTEDEDELDISIEEEDDSLSDEDDEDELNISIEEELESIPDEEDDTEIKDIAETLKEDETGAGALGLGLLDEDDLDEVTGDAQESAVDKLSFDNLDEVDDDEIDDEDFSIEDVEAVLSEKDELKAEPGDQVDETIADEDLAEEENDKVSELALIEENSDEPEIEDAGESEQISSAELEEMSETIRQLREDREKLLSQVEEYEINKDQVKRDFLSLEAQLDEKKIEINLAKKRFAEEYEKLNKKIDDLKSRETEGSQKNQELHDKIEQLNKKAYLDLRKIQLREKDLENQLSLLKTDTENQVRNRDIIILDLKRKIDILEFDIEQAWKQEKAAKREKLILQNKIDRLVASLKEVVEALHEDDIKKWLDEVEDDKDKS